MSDNVKICSINNCERPVLCKGWCGLHYDRDRKGIDMNKPIPAPFGAGFDFIVSLIFYTGDDCVNWPYSQADGYGKLKYKGKTFTASRLLLQLIYGEDAVKGMDSAHSCHNRLCCNPNHLRIATRKSNMMDKLADGTNIGGRKLTESEAIKIKYDTRIPYRVIAEDYNTTVSNVSSIKLGKSWKYI